MLWEQKRGCLCCWFLSVLGGLLQDFWAARLYATPCHSLPLLDGLADCCDTGS